MNLKYEIKQENLKVIEIKQIFLDKEKFGALTFDKSYEIANNTRRILVELQELGYQEKLTQQEAQEIDGDIEVFLHLIREVAQKSPEVDASFNLTVRNSLEENIISTCQKIQKRLRDKLVYLRQELALSKPEGKMLDEERKELARIRTEYEKNLTDLQKKIETLTVEKNTIESTHGEIAATRFGKHFESQSIEYENIAKDWLDKRKDVLTALYIIIGFNTFVYLYLFIFSSKLNLWPHFPPEDFFTLDYAVIKLAIILLLSHVLAFNSKNYSINKNLSVKNKHRKNVADTINSFLESNPDQEIKSQMLKQGSESMFKSEDTGYLGKINEKDHSPIEQITYIMPNKNTQ